MYNFWLGNTKSINENWNLGHNKGWYPSTFEINVLQTPNRGIDGLIRVAILQTAVMRLCGLDNMRVTCALTYDWLSRINFVAGQNSKKFDFKSNLYPTPNLKPCISNKSKINFFLLKLLYLSIYNITIHVILQVLLEIQIARQ